MQALAIVLVWGGLILFLQIFGGNLIGQQIGSADILSSFSAGAHNVWFERNGVLSRIDKNGAVTPSILYGREYPAISDLEISQTGNIFAATDHGLFISAAGLSAQAGLPAQTGAQFDLVTSTPRKENADVTALLFGADSNGPYGIAAVFLDGEGKILLSRDDFKTTKEIFHDKNGIVAMDAAGSAVYLGLGDGRLVGYSLDNGKTNNLYKFDSAVLHLKVAGGIIYASPRKGKIFASTDGGKTFSRSVFLDSYDGANTVDALAADVSHPGSVYALTDYGFIRGADAGKTWQVFTSLPDSAAKLTALRAVAGALIVASKDRIYLSKDNGKSWSVFNPHLSRTISTVLPVRGSIVVGTK